MRRVITTEQRGKQDNASDRILVETRAVRLSGKSDGQSKSNVKKGSFLSENDLPRWPLRLHTPPRTARPSVGAELAGGFAVEDHNLIQPLHVVLPINVL